MITKAQSITLRRLIKEYTKAAVDNSWAGAQEPEIAKLLSLEYSQAKYKLDKFIAGLIASDPPAL